MRLLARRSENSDAEDAERRTVCRGRVWWAAVRTPCGCGIGWRKVGRSIQDDSAAFDYRRLRNTLSRSVKTFLCDAIRLTRMRHHYWTHGLNTWMIHGGMIVSHSRHRIRRLNAMARALRLGVTFTHDCAEPGRSKNPGHHDREESYRSCGSLHHFSETVPQTG